MSVAETAGGAKRVPALRFPEFEEAWDEKRLEAMSKVTSGGTPSRTDPTNWDGEIPWVTTSEIGLPLVSETSQHITEAGLASSSAKLFPLGTVLVAMYGQGQTRGRVSVLGIEAATNQACAAILVEENLRSDFCYYNLFGRYEELRELANDGGQKNLSGGLIKALKIVLPSLPEQKKIAAFLGVVDAKIAGLKARQEGLERYKRGLMQALFSQRLRFTKPDGTAFPDWEEKRLGEVFTRVTRKNAEDNQNVLTISAQQGLVNQRDYFNKSVSAQDVTGYYLLEKGDFAYNKSYSKGYPMGAIKRLNDYDKGVVSTLYICFSSSSEVTSQFFEQFFDFGGLNREIHKIAQEGARNHGLLNMSVVEFFKDMVVPFPHPDEQQKIADALQAMDAKIAAVSGQVAKMEEFKKGLLQQMFV